MTIVTVERSQVAVLVIDVVALHLDGMGRRLGRLGGPYQVRVVNPGDYIEANNDRKNRSARSDDREIAAKRWAYVKLGDCAANSRNH